MDSTVDTMVAAYDALLDAAAAALREPGRAAAFEVQRCLDAFTESCDRAEDLVQAAAAGFGPDASGHDALCRAVHTVEQDLAGDHEENGMEGDKVPTPTTTPPAPVAVAAEDN